MPANNHYTELAQKAALAFCTNFNFLEKSKEKLSKPPLYFVDINRDGHVVTAYRWLDGGRGAEYVQVEISKDQTKVIVYGGYAHSEFGPWDYIISLMANHEDCN